MNGAGLGRSYLRLQVLIAGQYSLSQDGRPDGQKVPLQRGTSQTALEAFQIHILASG